MKNIDMLEEQRLNLISEINQLKRTVKMHEELVSEGRIDLVYLKADSLALQDDIDSEEFACEMTEYGLGEVLKQLRNKETELRYLSIDILLESNQAKLQKIIDSSHRPELDEIIRKLGLYGNAEMARLLVG